MLNRSPLLLRSAAIAAALTLAACGRSQEAELANLDNQIAAADPAITSALEDQIMVDPSLAQQSNRNAVRPPETPVQAQYPLPQNAAAAAKAKPAGGAAAGAADSSVRSGRNAAAGSGALAALQEDVGAQEGAACGAQFDYNAAWAKRLPSAFAVLPGARVTQAAGNDSGKCRVRVVTFLTDANYQRVLDWYHTRAVRAGYSSEHQLREKDHVLAGVSARDGGAFYLIVSPLPSGGADVALIANNGR